jgi:hypothetical protein
MGAISCPETSVIFLDFLTLEDGTHKFPETSVLFLDFLTLEDATDKLSRNVGNLLGLLDP